MDEKRDHFQRCVELFRKQWPHHFAFIERASCLLQVECYSIDQERIAKESDHFLEKLRVQKKLKTLFHYGLGMGGDFLIARKWLEKDPERLMVIFEDDLALICAFFHTAVAVEMLLHPQVLLVPIETDVQKNAISYPEGFEELLYVGIDGSYRLTVSEVYLELKPRLYRALRQSIHSRIQDFIWASAFGKKHWAQKTFSNLLHNLLGFSEMSRGQDLFTQFEDVPSLICAAGPSIQQQLPRIKKLKNRALIFGAGTGMNVLNMQGILPHFGCGIDPHSSSRSRISMNTAFAVPYFQTTNFNAQAAQLVHGDRLFFRGMEKFDTANWFLAELGADDQALHFGISTTCACLAIANHLSCRPIIFLGIDLSYTEKKRYPDGVAAHPTDVKSEQHSIEEFPQTRVIPATNSLGKRIFTRSDWINESIYYAMYAKKYPEAKLINGTIEGLVVQGVETLSLEAIEEKYLKRSYDITNWVHAEVVSAEKLTNDDEKIKEVISAWETSLEKGRDLLKEMIAILLDSDSEEVKETDHIGSEHYHKLMAQFKEEPIYNYLVEEMEMAYEKQKMRDTLVLRFHAHLLDPLELYQKRLLREFYRLNFLYKRIGTQLKVIAKMDWGYAEKKTPSQAGGEKVFAPSMEAELGNGLLKIKWEEGGVDLQEAFSPPKVKGDRQNDEQWMFASMERGIPHGEYLQYDRKGWLKSRGFYKKGKLHGPTIYYSKEGAVLAKGWFFNDQRQGINVQFYPSGSVYSIQGYKDDLPQGKQEFFRENGQLRMHYFYDEGALSGKAELFYLNGSKKRELNFLGGRRQGKDKIWSQERQLICESEFDQDLPVGVTRKWYENGQLKEERKFVDREGHYDVRIWNKRGELVKKDIYLSDKIDEEMIHSQEKRTNALDLLKKKMEGLAPNYE